MLPIFLTFILVLIKITTAQKIVFEDLNIYSNDSLFDSINHDAYALPNYPYLGDCKRPCVAGQSRTCRLIFVIEHYQAMGVACRNCAKGVLTDCLLPQCVSADGVEKGITTVNRQIPGPLIEVCQYDRLEINVVNNMHSESTAIHWHGILQRNTQYMDGVPYLTQCPINPGNTFKYTFIAEQYGTYFYHPHLGFQRYSGCYGGIIVRTPPNVEFVTNYYDKDEHVVILSDWSHQSSEMFNVGLPTLQPGFIPQNLLINGRGKYYDKDTNKYTFSPYAIFYVTFGLRYRFRVINAGSVICPMLLQIENHDMTIISSDGENVLPTRINSLYISSGERYDIVVYANKVTAINQSYRMRVTAVGLCSGMGIYQDAFIVYSTPQKPSPSLSFTPQPNKQFPLDITLNDPEAQCGSSKTSLCIVDLKNPKSPAILKNPTKTVYLTFEMKPLDSNVFFSRGEYKRFLNPTNDELLIGTMNNISNLLPPYPIISQLNQNDVNQFCNDGYKPSSCNNNEVCMCSHMFVVEPNTVLELVLIETSPVTFPLAHPFHLHGYSYVVIDQGRITGNKALTINDLKEMRRLGRLKGNNPYPAFKDNLVVQNQGYAIVRLYADNPGPWMGHCHLEDHMVFGMSVVMYVKGKIPPIPGNFPRCGNF